MKKNKRDSRGFTLIAALLLTVLLSGVAVGLMYMVSNEVRMGGNDQEGSVAYFGAEAGIENLTSQISQLYQSSQTPNAASITALVNPSNYPNNITGSNITYTNYVETITWPSTQTNGAACPNAPDPCGSWDVVGAGPDQGMVATLIPYTLQVTATRQSSSGQFAANSSAAATGASVNLTRTVEVALLPAFEFGVFCDGDCDYFAGPNFNFGGRVHANGNLFLASGSALTFTDKIAAAGQVILDQLENGHPTAAGYTGSVYIPTAAGGCPGAPGTGPATNCLLLSSGSWTGGFPPTGAANPAWKGISKTTFGGYVINGLTGATKLQLPFVQSSAVGAVDIIRKPQAFDSALLSSSRLYTKAEIRILLADTQLDLHPERGLLGDGQDVQFGVSVVNGTTQPVLLTSTGRYMYYANADTTKDANWVKPNGFGGTTWSLLGEVTNGFPAAVPSTWIRVEYLNTAGVWVGVTTQWLAYGFGRDTFSPSGPWGTAGQNPISPAILILQELKAAGLAGSSTDTTAAGTVSKYNWYPINFYDSREGEPRDAGARAGTTCSPIGVMNVVEIDVGNLWLWLQGVAPYVGGAGPQVNATKDNGYILYFSDHRGMIPNPNPPYNGVMSGESQLEDSINTGSAIGVPDGKLENKSYYAFSPEDVDGNGFLNQQGAQNLGIGFGQPANSPPYFISGVIPGITCPTIGRANLVTGPRHALRLVDGGTTAAGVSYLPHPLGVATSGNGFTVVSEEPVYVWGNYNSGPADPFWASFGAISNTTHSAAAIIADSVTLLSPNWSDSVALNNPGDNNPRNATDSYYRMAIAAGKSIPFPQPAWGGQDFGTDGGMHNFLRYLEDRTNTKVFYSGSLISMYYSQYNTGTFKCCNVVYGAPDRNYFFDNTFQNPSNLPPGTPMFQDVVSLSYHQNFTPQ